MQRNRIVILGIGLLLLLAPVILYFINFWGHKISKNTETWGQFGDYLNGTFMPIIALAGVIVTLLLGFISDRRNETNIKIEQQKHRPILHIGYIDSEHEIRIFMKNKGNGPLIITNYRLVHLQTSTEIPGVFNCLPEIQTDFDNYTGNQNNTVLAAEEETTLLLFELDEQDDEEEYYADRDLVRQSISNYRIMVDYKDVYDKHMPTYERSLQWFNRHFQT